jgi:hypothetical protein
MLFDLRTFNLLNAAFYLLMFKFNAAFYVMFTFCFLQATCGLVIGCQEFLFCRRFLCTAAIYAIESTREKNS